MFCKILLLLLSPWVCLCNPLPSPGYLHSVQFVKSAAATSFSSRTDHFVEEIASPWKSFEDVRILPFHVPPPAVDNHEASVHITPDFSDGLAYPDPFLRAGPEAQHLAEYLYSKQLFFNDIPHKRSLLYNQEMRIRNGLRPHALGSLRPGSPWYRYDYEDQINNSVF